MRLKRDFRTCSRTSYDKFCCKYPDLDISFETYTKILYTYNGMLANFLLETGESIKLPYGLGEIVINKYKQKKYKKTVNGNEIVGLAVDWQQSRIQGKKIYLLNTHTEGYRYYFMWRHSKTRFRMAILWNFKILRKYSRQLSSNLKKPNSKYLNIYKENRLV